MKKFRVLRQRWWIGLVGIAQFVLPKSKWQKTAL